MFRLLSGLRLSSYHPPISRRDAGQAARAAAVLRYSTFPAAARRHRAHRSSADNSPRGLIFSHELARGIPRRYPYTRSRSRPPISRWSCRACAPDTTNQPTLAVLISCRSGSWATKAPLRVAAQVNPAEYGELEPLALVRVPQRNHAPLTPPVSGSPRGTCCHRRRAPARPSTVVAGPGTASAAQNRVAVDVWCPGTRDRDRMAAPAALGAGTAASRASWPLRIRRFSQIRGNGRKLTPDGLFSLGSLYFSEAVTFKI